jgi:hypothetical protein
MGFFEDPVGVFWEINRREEGVLRRIIVGINSILGFQDRCL